MRYHDPGTFKQVFLSPATSRLRHLCPLPATAHCYHAHPAPPTLHPSTFVLHRARLPGSSNLRGRLPGGPEFGGQITWETKREDQITSTTILQKWTRLPGGPNYLVAAKSVQKWTRLPGRGQLGRRVGVVRRLGRSRPLDDGGCGGGRGVRGVRRGGHRSDRHRSRIASVRSASLARLCRQELRGDGCERFEAAHFLVRTSGHVRALAWGNWNRFVPG